MSRACTKCPRSAMPPNVRHLHELEPRDRFRFRESGDKGIVFELVSVSPGRCEIGQPARVERTTFERQRKGKTVLAEPETVSFDKVVRGLTTCAGSAEVEPLLTLEEQLARSVQEATDEPAGNVGAVEVIDLMQTLKTALGGGQ